MAESNEMVKGVHKNRHLLITLKVTNTAHIAFQKTTEAADKGSFLSKISLQKYPSSNVSYLKCFLINQNFSILELYF